MRRCPYQNLLGVFLLLCAVGCLGLKSYAQDKNVSTNTTEAVNAVVVNSAHEAASTAVAENVEAAKTSEKEEPIKPENITLDFKEADIRDVLKIISLKSGVNIVPSPEVTGTVNVRISEVPWERALDVILKTYGYAYDKQDKIIMVAPLEKLTSQRKMEQDLAQVQPVVTIVMDLKYIDAGDAKKAIEPQLSPRGKVTVLEVTGQAGWGFGGSITQAGGRAAAAQPSRSRTIIVSDIPPVLDKIKKVLEDIDVKLRQVLIETRIVEVDLDKLKDFGFDYGTGGAGSATSTTVTTQSVVNGAKAGATVLSSKVQPAAFDPQAAAISGTSPYNTGLQLVFQRLSGTKFEVLLHALEENVASKTLSAPSILTLDNQEATILLGEKFPIIQTTSSSDTATTVGTSLQYYQDIGIQLRVVPQVCGVKRDFINLIVHPMVTEEGSLVSNYPIIITREAQTQVLMMTGETVMIGGLIKDLKTDNIQGVPFLRKIPLIGKVFERKTVKISKVELLIFITARIVDDRNLTAEELNQLEQKMGLRSFSHK